ncbi:IS3 family transposase [Levilactobacillus hammesii]|nr:IS3 family transposase [Levilactobacillus hammesii]
MAELRQELDVKLAIVLKAAKMSSSSYHDAIKREYQTAPTELVDRIRKIREDNLDYGYRTVTAALKTQGTIVNHKAVLRIMRENNLLCHAFDRRTTKYSSYRGTVGTVAKNRLNRRFKTDRPFQKVVTDVTEIRWGDQTTQERVYFTAYIDLHSGEMLEWAISLSPTVEFVTKPLERLIKNRPDLPYRMTVHSDQGFQYQNKRYVNLLKESKVYQSMSRKATCLDNAVAESTFNIFKVGTVHNHQYSSYEELKVAVSNYVEYYNHRRIRTKLAGMTPVEYRNHASQLAA